MANTIISGTSRESQSIWHKDGSGILRQDKHAGMPVVILNTDDIKISVSGLALDLSIDELESLTTTGNATLSGIESGVDGLETLIGTTNTTLSGIDVTLSSIDAAVDTVEPLLVALSGFTDTTEPLLDAISGINLGISAFVDDIEPSLDTANTTLSGIESGVDGLEALTTTGNSTLSGIEAGVDGLEALIGTTNTTLANIDTTLATSGNIITDPDGTTQARVLVNTAIPSGDIEALAVTLDTKLSSTEVLTSGTIGAAALSSGIDVSAQLGFYNNALFILSDVATSIEILANSDDGGLFALVKTVSIAAADQAAYYDLKGYETTIKIRPDTSGEYQVFLIKNR